MSGNIHSDKGVVDCPQCNNYACIHHMKCHYCNYTLRMDDL